MRVAGAVVCCTLELHADPAVSMSPTIFPDTPSQPGLVPAKFFEADDTYASAFFQIGPDISSDDFVELRFCRLLEERTAIKSFIAIRVLAVLYDDKTLYCRTLFKQTTKTQLDEIVRGYIRTDLKEGGRVGIISFEEFCRNQPGLRRGIGNIVGLMLTAGSA